MSIVFPKEIIQCDNFIGGVWQQGSGPAIDVFSPYNGQVVGRIHESSDEDVDEAVALALVAQKAWAAVPIKERTQVFFRFREILLRDMDAICNTICLENGKTMGEARASLMKGIEVLEFGLSLQNMDEGGKMEVSREVHCEYRREPLGVVAGITP